jgi:predicted phage terminase large subunit-like protein
MSRDSADLALLELLRDEQRGREATRRFDWAANARPDQLPPPGDWRTWLILAGRGWGKTRTGAETVRSWVGLGYRRIALVGPTAADVRDVMIEGESGILNVFPDGERPIYEPSKRRVLFANGAIATAYTADEPDRLRGPQHDAAWCDELAAWRRGDAAWSNLLMGLRIGLDPRVVVTTTPRPIPLVKGLMAVSTTTTTRGRTLDNAANLAPQFLDEIVSRYEGTRLGRQELEGEMLEIVDGALWSLGQFDRLRVEAAPAQLERIVVAVDPAVSTNEKSDYTGIVVAGIAPDKSVYILHAEAMKASPSEWAARVWDLFDHWQADRVVAERNNGGDLVEQVLRQVRRTGSLRTVVAKRGKALRAEPVAHLYELGRVHHVGPFLRELEDQMSTFPVACEHDDLVDALAYAVLDLTNTSSAPVEIGTGSPW